MSQTNRALVSVTHTHRFDSVGAPNDIYEGVLYTNGVELKRPEK